jgi:serine/threonine protein kinase
MCISPSEATLVTQPSPSSLALSRSPQFADFECFGRLGIGRYGNVFGVQHCPSGKYLAIKLVNGSKDEERRQFALEKQILLHYHHDNPYIIKGYCSFHCGVSDEALSNYRSTGSFQSNLFLAMEFVDGDRLGDTLQRTRMNEEEVRFYLVELISVIQYLHCKRIIYR